MCFSFNNLPKNKDKLAQGPRDIYYANAYIILLPGGGGGWCRWNGCLGKKIINKDLGGEMEKGE